MPVPKKRVGHSEQGHRRSTWKATVPAISKCTNCGAPRHPHTMCGVCGFYNDRVVLKALQGDDFEMPAAIDPVEPELAEDPKPEKQKKKTADETQTTEEPEAKAPDVEVSEESDTETES